ncbi:Eco57I restriction-modification methylase domain-containing protein [Lacrimispora defluvii]|jgi:hypothetical protein|uniref:site-specific DNA-methyltransferase (adenine-specific) n=1 Tax=Lacrimispora defluvii TaxID=2719233 RepID=A0ABX1VPR4_9FIRM|nr:N-6 DNA methylase [Lacrimispora defluvii]NNJ30447.1 N-6 DNA methylase [Lacrimispora defluvii]
MDLGQIFTNNHVAKYMASLFNLDNEDSILDPCFGDGVFLKACLSQGYNNISGYELDENLFNEVRAIYPALDLYNVDFLNINREKKYDGIIMNPPYIRQEKIDDLKHYGITKEILRKNSIFDKLPKTANLYMYFIFKAIDLLKTKGQLVVIFPSSWLKTRSGKSFEKTLYSQCTLKQQIHISGEVFEKEALVDVVILDLIKGKVAIKPEIKNLEFTNKQLVDKGIFNVEDDLGFSESFSKYARIRRGLTTGFNAMFINPVVKESLSKEMLVPIISSPKAIKGFNTEDAEVDMLFSLSRDDELNDEISAYLTNWKKSILQKASPITLYKKIQQGVPWYLIKTIDSKGILFSYFVRNDMKFIDNDSGTLVRDNFYIIYPKINRMLLFALLNNYYTYYQLEKSGKKYGAGLLKLQRYDIEDLMFPDISQISSHDQVKICKLAEELSSEGDASLVRKITEIISSYSNVSYEEVTNWYSEIKKHRLEGYTNGN